MFNFLKRLFSNKKHLWLEVPSGDPFTASTAHGTHHFEFVSRHAIAETGLHCPMCKNEVSPRGDYRLVRQCRLGDVVRCNGTRQVNDEDIPCPAYLIASPDTEHGDHLVYDKTPQHKRMEKFCRFVRIAEADAAKLRYGADAITKGGEVFATTMQTETAPPVQLPRLALKAGQTWQTDDGRQVLILRVQNDGDKVFDGWAWCNIVGEQPFEWHVDPTGRLRQTMRDPTSKDKGRLITETRPV